MRKGSGRPTRGYRLADGTKVPSVTTILSRFKDSGGLVHWAWQQGIDGRDYRVTTKEAAGAGSITHELIEADILGRPATIPTADELKLSAEAYAEAEARAWVAFGGFLDWRRSVDLDVVVTEDALVSEKHGFAGCVDAIARTKDGLVVFDWKTSNRIYADYIVQVAAYRALWEEVHPEEESRITGIKLVRVGKQFGDYHVHSWPLSVCDIGWKAFLLQLELYGLDADLKAAAGG